MYCPYCQTGNDQLALRCRSCQADISSIKEQLYLGSQFVFVRADQSKPVALKVNGILTHVESDTILSRFDNRIQLFDRGNQKIDYKAERRANLIRLPQELGTKTAGRLAPITVVSDRKIYRKGDVAQLILVAPHRPFAPLALEIRLTGQKILDITVALNGDGLALYAFEVADEGAYEVVVYPTANGERSDRAEYSFSCAAFSLSPLLATLVRHTLDQHTFAYELEIKQLAQPYSGPATVRIKGGEEIVTEREVEVAAGHLSDTVELTPRWWRWMNDQLVLEVTTPAGHTAALQVPNSSTLDRESIPLTSLTPNGITASLSAQTAAGQTVRGLTLTDGAVENELPLRLEAVVGNEGVLWAETELSKMLLTLSYPLSGETESFEFVDVEAGQSIPFPIPADEPYLQFSVGCLATQADKAPFESFGVVIRPAESSGRLSGPTTAVPGSPIDLTLKTDRPATCLLVVYDPRLQHENPLPKLSKKIFEHLRRRAGQARHQTLQAASDFADRRALNHQIGVSGFNGGRMTDPFTEGLLGFDDEAVLMRSARSMPMMDMMMETAGLPEEADTVDVALPEMSLAARESFPELIFCELFLMETEAIKRIVLGDQIGTWRCRAYFFSGVDWSEATHDISAELDLYTELDVPALAGPADAIWGQAVYHSKGPALLTIKTGRDQFEHQVNGDGVVEFPISGPGEIETDIRSDKGQDIGRRIIPLPGRETVTASKLRLLRPGEAITGKPVVAYPSASELLAETIKALIRYPFG